jgi:hypothetical protein
MIQNVDFVLRSVLGMLSKYCYNFQLSSVLKCVMISFTTATLWTWYMWLTKFSVEFIAPYFLQWKLNASVYSHNSFKGICCVHLDPPSFSFMKPSAYSIYNHTVD